MDVISFNYDGSIKLQLLSCRGESEQGVLQFWTGLMKRIRDEINAIAIKEYANLSGQYFTAALLLLWQLT